MKRYVAGFLFDEKMARCAFVRKLKPEWQAGRLNAIGGKIEGEETPLDAMRREFREETGVDRSEWRLICILEGDDFQVHFFQGYITELDKVRTMESEPIEIHPAIYQPDMLPNLEWLIPMAKSLSAGRDRAKCFRIIENY